MTLEVGGDGVGGRKTSKWPRVTRARRRRAPKPPLPLANPRLPVFPTTFFRQFFFHPRRPARFRFTPLGRRSVPQVSIAHNNPLRPVRPLPPFRFVRLGERRKSRAVGRCLFVREVFDANALSPTKNQASGSNQWRERKNATSMRTTQTPLLFYSV